MTLLAAALGVWVSVGVSGGHINPAVRFYSTDCWVQTRTDEPALISR
jgi:glycerol uptake facilitator-like aquaporin